MQDQLSTWGRTRAHAEFCDLPAYHVKMLITCFFFRSYHHYSRSYDWDDGSDDCSCWNWYCCGRYRHRHR